MKFEIWEKSLSPICLISLGSHSTHRNIPILVPTHTYQISLPPFSSLRPLQCLSEPPTTTTTKKKIQVVETKAFRILLPPPSHGMPQGEEVEHSTSCALARYLV